MPQYLHLPDGSGIALKEGEDPKEVWARAQQLYPDAFGIMPKKEAPAPTEQPQSGFVPAFKSSASQLKADLAALAGKTGIIAPERAEQIGKEEAEYQKKTFAPTTKGWLEAPGTKFGELLGGSVPYVAAPLAAGLGALALPEAAAAAPFVGGALEGLGLGTVGEATAAGLAGAASTTQFTGSNLSRQMEAGKSLADTNLGSAVGAAIPQAALDVFGLRMIPGIRNIFAEAGHKISDAEARAIASQGLKKTLGDYALNTGKVAGAEGLTEAGQQVLERLQAGLSLTDPDAQKEYFDNFLGGAVLGATLGVPGRFVERGQAKAQAAAADRADKAKQLAEQQALQKQQEQDQEAFKQTPEYVTDLTKRWNTLQDQLADLDAKRKVKITNPNDLAAVADKRDAARAYRDLIKAPETEDLVEEYRPYAAKVKQQQEEDARQKDLAEKQAEYEKTMRQPGAQGELFPELKTEQPETPAIPSAQEFNDLQAHIGRRMHLATINAAEATDEDEIAKHANDHAALTQAQANLEKLRPQVEQAEPNAHLISSADLNFEDNELELKRQRGKLEKAQQLGDIEAIKKASDKIQELKKRPSLFGEDNTRPALEAAQDAERIKFTEEIEAHRQEAIAQRQKLADEVARLQKIADANKQKGVFEGSVAQKQLEDAKTMLASFRPKPYKTQSGKIIMPPALNQDWSQFKKEVTSQQQSIEDEPSNKELLDQRIEGLLNQLLPRAIAGAAPTNRVISRTEQLESQEKAADNADKIQKFKHRLEELRAILPAIHADIAQGYERPAYPELQKEYQYLQGRINELESLNEPGPKAGIGPGRYLPIEEAQKELDRAKTNKSILARLNEAIQKAGRPTDPAKVKELESLKAQRANVQEEIDDATNKYNTMVEREQRPTRAEKTEQGDLFALSGEYGKSASEVQRIKNQLDAAYKEREDIKAGLKRRSQEARTPQLQELLDKYSKEPTGRYQQLSKQIERLEQEHLNATGKASEKFQAFSEEREAEKQPTVRTEEQKMLPGFGLKQYTELKKPVPKETLAAARTKQIELQTKLENVRKQAGKIANPALETKLNEQIEKAKAKVADLERKQRMYEEQQDAINKAPPGQRAAQRLIAGEGYRTIKGETRVKPTKLESWGIENIKPVKTPPPSAVAKATAVVEKAKKTLEQAAAERNEAQNVGWKTAGAAKANLFALNENVDRLAKELQQAFPHEKSLDVFKEILALDEYLEKYGNREKLPSVDKLLENYSKDLTPAETLQTLSTMLTGQGYLNKQIEDTEKKLKNLKTKYDSIVNEKYYTGPALEAQLEPILKQAEATDKAHTAAVVKYAMARRDMLALQYNLSSKVREEYTNAVKARDAELALQKEDPALKDAAEATAKARATHAEAEKRLNEANDKLKEQVEKIKGQQRVKEAQKEEARKKANAIYEGIPTDVAQRAREGLGLEGTRVELDTTGVLAQAVQNNAKKMLGMAQTQLKQAIDRGDEKAVNKHTLEVKRYERELQEVLPVAEKKVTKITEEKEPSEQAEVEPGERLPNRREGPVVRTAARAPSAMLSGTAESRTPIGKGNRPKQAGVIKLRASDLSPEKANAVSLHATKEKLDAAKDGTKRKETLQKQYDNAVAGLTPEQVQERLEEGARIMKEGGSMELIAARERLREAHLEVTRSEKTLENAKTKAEKELARDDLERAIEKEDRAEERYKNVKAETYAKKVTETAEDAVESDIEFTDTASPFDRLNKAIEDADDDFFAAAAREAPGTVLPDEAIKALLDKSLIGALEHIADSDKGFLGQHADAVRQFLMRTKVEIVPEIIHKGKSVPALYDPTTNTAYFTPQGFTVEDVVHEATHAATMRVLTMPEKELTPSQLAARRELSAMLAKLSTNPKFEGQYGLKNLKEFASEIMANENLRDLMSKQPWYRGNMLTRFFKALVDLFRKTPITENMLPRAEELVRSMFLQSRNIEAEAAAAAPAYKSALVGSSPGKWENFKGNFFGLAGRVQLVDKLAAVDAGLVAGEGEGKLTSLEAFQTQYFMRMGDQVSTAAGQFILHGPMKIVYEDTPQGREYRYESQDGANLVQVSEHLGDMAKALGISTDEAERMATVLIAGERAKALTDGWSRLNADNPTGVKAEFDADTTLLNSNKEAKSYFQAVRKAYKEYNDGQLDFAVQSGFLSKDEAERLKRMPYIPYYRIQDGVVKLFTTGEHAITIGNIKDNPDLKQMIGDNQHILPLLTSAVQNTFMLTRMSLHNKATLETANALNKAGFVSKMGTGKGFASVNTVHYKIGGKDAFATIDADTFGIPAHLIVKGMEGIKTTIPALVKMMGVPSQWVRKFVTRFPAYGVRQLLRDPVNSFILSGTDGVPMVNALKELSQMYKGQSQAEQDLMRGLAVSSNIFSGDEKDMTKFLQDITTGKSSWQKMLGHLDKFALQADTATRATIYNDGLKKGLTKAQAQFRAFESQNLSRRGLSPSMQMANTLIPFFNSQVQGLDVLYRSLTNKMPFAEQMEIKRKLVARSMMLMGVSMAYALMMQDDEDYRKARPEERYNNFFVHLPFVKEPLRIPIPYEVGILFKALPEALIDASHKDMTAHEAARGMGKLVWQNAVPSLIPAAPKPILEAFYGQTATGPIETQREKTLMATERYRANTTEAAKLAGQLTGKVGVSPIMLEHFIRGYTGSMGLAALHMIDPILASSEEGEKASTPASKVPFVGGLFQPEGRYLVERAYERMNDVEQAKATYMDMVKKGQRANAESFRQNYANLIAAGQAAGAYKKNMGTLFSQERMLLANPKLSKEEKDTRLDALHKHENEYAQRFTEEVDRRALQ